MKFRNQEKEKEEFNTKEKFAEYVYDQLTDEGIFESTDMKSAKLLLFGAFLTASLPGSHCFYISSSETTFRKTAVLKSVWDTRVQVTLANVKYDMFRCVYLTAKFK